MDKTVVFVCPHGAGKSRLAAAWFAGAAPPGWRATSASITPQDGVSVHAPRLLAGTAAADHLDTAPPRPISAVGDAALIVTIDCPDEAVDIATVRWRLDHADFDNAMNEEIRARAEALAASLADVSPRSLLEHRSG